MAQPLICDNHPEEPREAVLLLTQTQTGEIMKLCADCWPMAFAGMLDALPTEERPTPPGATAEPPAGDNGAAPASVPAGDGDNVVPMTKPKAQRKRARATD